jgi:DNA-binding LytR/AlgR family response regulator
MKITIENIPDGSEPEIIIKCNQMDESLMRLVYSVKSAYKKLVGNCDNQIYMVEQKDVFYFEAVDNKVFIYCREKVFESKQKLYEIEKEYDKTDFFRASKSIILNLSKIESLRLDFGGRFEALLQNGEKVIISRQYVPMLKQKLGL